MIIKKKNFFIISLVLLVLSISTIVYATEATITVNNLNVRSGPGLNYEVIAQVHENEVYQVVTEQGNWVQIQIGDLSGWVTKDYIVLPNNIEPDLDKQNTEIKENEETTIVYLEYEEVNVRNGPSTDYKIIGSAKKGDSFQVISEQDDWLEISWENESAFIPAQVVNTTHKNTIPSKFGLKQKSIVIDAGHGGYDVGAIGASERFEKDYTFQTAKKLKEILETLGANVILTRETDHYYSLSGRASVSNLAKADAFLSIHYNSTPQYPNASGVSTYYYSESDQRFAELMQNSLLSSTGMDDRGMHNASFQVLRENHQPALLLELGFLSNVQEENDIQSDLFQDKIAKGIVAGLTNFFNN